MKKSFLNLTHIEAISKNEQKNIIGGRAPLCDDPEIACYFPATHKWQCVLPQYCDC
jgi:hypothetical protein